MGESLLFYLFWGLCMDFGVPWLSASLAWQAWHNVHSLGSPPQGLGCTPWRPLGLRLFCVAGVAQCALPRAREYVTPWRPLGLRLFGVAGVAQCALPWVSASFAWQAWAWATPNGPVSNTFFLVAKTWPISWECSRCLMRLTKPTENAKATHGYESL